LAGVCVAGVEKEAPHLGLTSSVPRAATVDAEPMHGYSGSVERKIQLWVAQQESNRRRERAASRAQARAATPAPRGRRTAELRAARKP
jgi:hypothetical protein